MLYSSRQFLADSLLIECAGEGGEYREMIDRIFRIVYVCAYWMMRFYWAVRRPHTHGALVAIWHDNTILLVRNSYLQYYSLPGGYVRRNETARQAAIRELTEEVGVLVSDDMLTLAVDVVHDWERRHDHVEIFVVELPERPSVKVDNREVVATGFFTPEEALKLKLFPPIRQHIEERLAAMF